jgi:hypothetical protein
MTPEDPNVIPLHTEMHEEILLIKEVHLRKLNDDIQGLKEDFTEHRTESKVRIDKLDERVWALLLTAVATLISVIGGIAAVLLT